jgi:hypothetical protein
MLYFLYMTTLLSNNIFHHNLQSGTIEYVNKYPFVKLSNQILESSRDNPIEVLNITLLNAQKYILQHPIYIGFTFDASDNIANIEDISGGSVGNAYFFKEDSTLSNGLNRCVYLIKNNGMAESVYSEVIGDYYYGEFDYVKFTIPPVDVSSIHQTVLDLSQNLTLLSRFIPIDMISEITEITVQPLSNEESYIDYYFYIWEDINGPWFNGTELSMSPSYKQLTDSNYNIRPITFNDISNQQQIDQSDINGKNIYTYNYSNTPASDTSSNYIRVFKIDGTYGINNGVPEQSSLILTSPKYTKYNFLWTYSIKNSYKLIFKDINNATKEYSLEGNAPFFTPNLRMYGTSFLFDYFSDMGSVSSHFSSLDVERIYKATKQPSLSYNSGQITITLPSDELLDISNNFINRYTPDNRIGTRYLKDPIIGTEYIHLYEDNQITKISYNIYIFINNSTHYGTTLTNNTVDLSNITVNNNHYPYGDNLFDISYDVVHELSDNSIYYEQIPQSVIDYGNIPYNGEYNDVSRNRYNNEDDIDGLANVVNAITVLQNDSIHKYFGYDSNSSLNVQILRVKKNDLLNNPNYAHIISTDDWSSVHKKFQNTPISNSYIYTMNSNEYYIRWNYNIERYHYDKTTPIDFTKAYYSKTAYNTGISKYTYFDFTQFGVIYYPNKLLDVSYGNIAHYDSNNEVDFYYKNLNISFPESIRNEMIVNFNFNHNFNIRARVNIFILKPDYINDSDQAGTYNTSSIDYNSFDLSFSFYDSTTIIPQNISIDISENKTDNTLLAGKYTIEWNYEIEFADGTDTSYLPMDKINDYQVQSTIANIPFEDFIYDLSGVEIYSNSNFTNLFLEFSQNDIHNFIEHFNLYNKTLDLSNTFVTINFNLFTPNNEQSQSGGNFWSLPSGYQGPSDPRLYQVPVQYLDKTIFPSPTLVYENISEYGDVGFDIRNASYVGETLEHYNLTKTFDISSGYVDTLDGTQYVSDISSFIIEMNIPEGTVNNTINNINWGLGDISNIKLDDIVSKVDGVHIGVMNDYSNNTILFYKDGNSYLHNDNNNQSVTGIVRWLFQKKNNSMTVTININQKNVVYLENIDIPITKLSIVGSLDVSSVQNASTIRIYNTNPTANEILMNDISSTDIIFHQIKEASLLGSNTEYLPQSESYLNATSQIPYICRMDINIHDKTSNFKFNSIMRTPSKKINNIYHRITDWDISYNFNNEGGQNYFFNQSPNYPFQHKYIYGVGFITAVDAVDRDFYYPQKLDIQFDNVTSSLLLEIKDYEILKLKLNLVDFWNAIFDRTKVSFVYYGWISKSQKIRQYIDPSLDPNSISDISSVIRDLSNVEVNSETVDFYYQVSSNQIYENNVPSIPKSIFIINKNDVRSGQYYVGWTYVIDNTWNINKIPPTTAYDLSLASITVPTIHYNPGNVNIEIQNDISQVVLNLSNKTIQDLSRNIYYTNFDYNDISQVNLHYYLWTPNTALTNENMNGWELPNNYNGVNDTRIKEYPAIYYDLSTNKYEFYDISYNGNLGLDKTKAFVKTVSGKDLMDLSNVIFTPSDFGLYELPYSSDYYNNGQMIPYICTWGYSLIMKSTSSFANKTISSDISNSSDSNFIFREPNWIINYDSSNNAYIQNSEYNKYVYNNAILIEIIQPPEADIIYNSYRCGVGGCAKTTTKTSETLNFVQRYSSLFNTDFRLASKLGFDCNN